MANRSNKPIPKSSNLGMASITLKITFSTELPKDFAVLNYLQNFRTGKGFQDRSLEVKRLIAIGINADQSSHQEFSGKKDRQTHQKSQQSSQHSSAAGHEKKPTDEDGTSIHAPTSASNLVLAPSTSFAPSQTAPNNLVIEDPSAFEFEVLASLDSLHQQAAALSLPTVFNPEN